MCDAKKLQAIIDHLRDKSFDIAQYKAFGLDPWYLPTNKKKALREAMACYLSVMVGRFADHGVQGSPVEDSPLQKMLAEKAQEPGRTVGLSSGIAGK